MGKSPNPSDKSAGEGSGSNAPRNDDGKTSGSPSGKEPESSRPGDAKGIDVGGSSATPPRPQVAGGTAVGRSSSVIGAGGSSQEGNIVRPHVEGGAAKAEGSQEGPRRKRTRTEDPSAGSSSTKTKFDAPEVATPCSVCGKRFPSWKSLFGHMRSHPDRQWRGVFPPPTFNREGSPENTEQVPGENLKQAENEMASCLLNLAKGVMEKLGKSTDQPSTQTDKASAVDGSGPSGSNMGPSSSQVQEPASSSSSQRRVLNIDLNVPQEASPSSPAAPPPHHHQSDASGFDLNMPAPPGSDDEAAS